MGIEWTPEQYDHVYKYKESYHWHYTKSRYYGMWQGLVFKINKTDTVLDIGCGTGQLACMIKDYGIINYIGIDFSSTAIRIAKEKCLEGDFICEDIFNSSIIEKLEYDTVVSTEFFEHIENDFDILKRIQKLQKHIKLLISVPDFKAPNHVRYFKNQDQIYNRYESYINDMDISVYGPCYLITGWI